eukprot:756272-Hanusia_phi.AAC.2
MSEKCADCSAVFLQVLGLLLRAGCSNWQAVNLFMMSISGLLRLLLGVWRNKHVRSIQHRCICGAMFLAKCCEIDELKGFVCLDSVLIKQDSAVQRKHQLDDTICRQCSSLYPDLLLRLQSTDADDCCAASELAVA